MVPGMDGHKEKYVSLYGDPWMQRGFAFLAVEGPGYWEAPLRGIYTDVSGWVETGKEVMKWLLARPEIDPDKIVVIGSSFGSFFSAIMMSNEPRYRACAVTGTLVPRQCCGGRWVQARLAGKPLTSEYWFVEPSGRIDKTPLS